jgi:hypothetical protein
VDYQDFRDYSASQGTDVWYIVYEE